MQVALVDSVLIVLAQTGYSFWKLSAPDNAGQILHCTKSGTWRAEARAEHSTHTGVPQDQLPVAGDAQVPGRPEFTVNTLNLESGRLQTIGNPALAAVTV